MSKIRSVVIDTTTTRNSWWNIKAKDEDKAKHLVAIEIRRSLKLPNGTDLEEVTYPYIKSISEIPIGRFLVEVESGAFKASDGSLVEWERINKILDKLPTQVPSPKKPQI